MQAFYSCFMKFCLALNSYKLLFRIQLDDLHFVNRNIDHFAGRTLFYNTFECLKISLDPFWSQTAACNLYDVFISLRGFFTLFDFDGITSAYKVRRDIYLFAVNQNVFCLLYTSDAADEL